MRSTPAVNVGAAADRFLAGSVTGVGKNQNGSSIPDGERIIAVEIEFVEKHRWQKNQPETFPVHRIRAAKCRPPKTGRRAVATGRSDWSSASRIWAICTPSWLKKWMPNPSITAPMSAERMIFVKILGKENFILITFSWIETSTKKPPRFLQTGRLVRGAGRRNRLRQA